MTRQLAVLAGVALAGTLGLAGQQPGGYDLLQQALAKERAAGQIEQAIALYEQIVREHAADRPLAARALVQLGRCYEKLGRAEARPTYERVVREFADQADLAAEARARLGVLGRPVAAASTGPVARRIWAGPQVDDLVMPSPDGRYFSYVDWTTGDLAVRGIANGETRRLTNKSAWETSREFALFSVPSPDGRQIAYSWFNGKGSFDLRLVGLDGGPPRLFYGNPEFDYIQPIGWSPGARALAVFLATRDRTGKIGMVTIRDGQLRVLKTLDWRQPGKLSLSPDGRFIAYDFPDGPGTSMRDIFLLDTSGARETVLVDHPANDTMPVWTPDGRHVVFLSDRAGTTGAWVVRVADGEPAAPPVLIKPDMGRVVPFGFTRTGALYYGVEAGLNDIYVSELDPATGRAIVPPSALTMRFVGSVGSPSWSPDGSTLAYISQRGPVPGQRSRTIVLHSIASGDEQELPLPMSRLRRVRWAPNGESLLLVGRDDRNREGLYRFDLRTRTLTGLLRTEPGQYVVGAEWLPDGRAVVYSVRESAASGRVARRNLETGDEMELYRGGLAGGGAASNLVVSPTGKWAALWTRAREKDPLVALTLLPLAGGAPRELLYEAVVDLPGVGALAWTPDGQHVLFVQRQKPIGPDNPRHELRRIRADGTDLRTTGLAMDGLREISVHPDGRRIAFTAGWQRFEIWVMENFLPGAKPTAWRLEERGTPRAGRGARN